MFLYGMGKVVEIGIADTKGGRVKRVNTVDAFKGKGLLNDRKFKENNQKECQITLIEIENINHFNKISKTSISPVDFRRTLLQKIFGLTNLLIKSFLLEM